MKGIDCLVQNNQIALFHTLKNGHQLYKIHFVDGFYLSVDNTMAKI